MAVDCSYYNDIRFDDIDKKYLPPRGEGNTLATQIVVAVNKLIYKWYNDGDVYDNTYYLEGWYNDLSSYANWLYKYADAKVLGYIRKCRTESDYEDLLKDLCDSLLVMEKLDELNNIPKKGSVYDCDGIFMFE